jgi:hypothetical protein
MNATFPHRVAFRIIEAHVAFEILGLGTLEAPAKNRAQRKKHLAAGASYQFWCGPELTVEPLERPLKG